MRGVMCSEDARSLMGAYNAAVARDPMAARSEFLNGFGFRKLEDASRLPRRPPGGSN
jgi:hypothetical protein